MKQIKIVVGIDERTGKIATAREFSGYEDGNISHQFEILGIMENLVDIQKENVKMLAKKKIV
ncbi:MAG: hypothetical protein IH845_05215 [Nanoarchaeota archaeon]|nr:hypothetical protein [Nanoarchaeota archaeon]